MVTIVTLVICHWDVNFSHLVACGNYSTLILGYTCSTLVTSSTLIIFNLEWEILVGYEWDMNGNLLS